MFLRHRLVGIVYYGIFLYLFYIFVLISRLLASDTLSQSLNLADFFLLLVKECRPSELLSS